MRILITGANGMLGSMLTKRLQDKNHEVIPTDRTQIDITNKENIHAKLDEIKPDALVNCAAYTNVEAAEDDEETCNLINAIAPGYLAKACVEKNITFVHISSDYTFGDNNPEGHKEDDQMKADQLNKYARSKWLGDNAVLENNSNAYIVRTQWIFGPGGKNFVDVMLALAETRDELNIVDDEIGVPTYTKDLADNLVYLLENKDSLKPGFYHGVNEGTASRYEEAEAVFEFAKKKIKLNRVKLESFPRKAKVANYSILHNTKLPKKQGWREAVREYIESK